MVSSNLFAVEYMYLLVVELVVLRVVVCVVVVLGGVVYESMLACCSKQIRCPAHENS